MTATATTLPVWAAYSPATDTTELPAVLRDPAQFLPQPDRPRRGLRTLLIALVFVFCAVCVAVAAHALTPVPAAAGASVVLDTTETVAEPTGHGGIR